MIGRLITQLYRFCRKPPVNITEGYGFDWKLNLLKYFYRKPALLWTGNRYKRFKILFYFRLSSPLLYSSINFKKKHIVHLFNNFYAGMCFFSIDKIFRNSVFTSYSYLVSVLNFVIHLLHSDWFNIFTVTVHQSKSSEITSTLKTLFWGQKLNEIQKVRYRIGINYCY